MKVSRLIELLGQCSPDADVRIYFSEGNYSDGLQSVEHHVGQNVLGGEIVFLYSFLLHEESVKEIWPAGKTKVLIKEPDFLKTETT